MKATMETTTRRKMSGLKSVVSSLEFFQSAERGRKTTNMTRIILQLPILPTQGPVVIVFMCAAVPIFAWIHAGRVMPLRQNMAFRTERAVGMSLALKKTKAAFTKLKVRNHENHRGIGKFNLFQRR